MDTTVHPSKISRLSLFFVRNWRVSILFFVGVLGVGFLSYTTLLKREGFPPIEVPVALVQTAYFAEDIALVDEEVTTPIEQAIADIPEIRSVQSTTVENFSNIVVEFGGDTTSAEGSDLLKEAIESEVALPDQAEISYQTFNAGAFDGENDLIFNLVNDDVSREALQAKANELADEVAEVSGVTRANVVALTEQQTNPFTGEEVTEETRFGRVAYREDGELVFRDAISIGAVRNPEVGTIEFSEAVQEKVDELKESDDLDGYTVVFGGGDLSNSLRQQIANLESNALTGLLAVMVILFLFVNWRASLMMMFFVPAVMAATFIGLYLIGYSLNTLSLFALILVIGIVSDDAIIVIDSIDYYKKKHETDIRAIIRAINNVGVADISGTLTTVLVFFPLAAVSGILGEFIRLIPITVILALFLSLFIGLTLIPFLSNILLPASIYEEKKGWQKVFAMILSASPRFIDWIGRGVYRFVHGYLGKWWLTGLVILASFGVIGGSFVFANQLEFAIFAPAKDTDAITVNVTLPEEARSLESARNLTLDVEQVINREVSEYVDDITYFETGASGAFLYVTLTPIGERDTTSTTIVEEIESGIRSTPTLANQNIKVEKAGAGPPTDEYQVTLQIFAEETETLTNATDEVKNYLEGDSLNLGEDIEGEVTEVAVSNLTNLSKTEGERFASVRVKVSEPTDTGLILAVQEAIEAEFDTDEFKNTFGLTDDAVRFDLGQEGENLDSFQSALFAMAVALVAMYALLVFQFNSFTQPLLILTAIPFAFPGLFPGLLATNNPLSFFVMVGIIGLIGIVVNNTILLLDFANQSRKEGLSIREAVSEAIGARFRPLLTTSMTTLFGILPLALSDPFWEPLAFSIIFGLLSSSLLVILVFPSYYATLEGARYLFWEKLLKKHIHRH